MRLDPAKTLLLQIDVQNDFCPAYTLSSGDKRPEGALAVQGGGEVAAPLNALARALVAAGGRVAATQDWHPAGHVSFASSHPGRRIGDTVELGGTGSQILCPSQLLWPDHCVQGSGGAAFYEGLDTGPISLVIRKGFRPGLDSYSAFFENDRKTPTGLEGFIRFLGIDTVLLGGLATDYCVRYSALDCAALGFRTIIAVDAVRAVNYPPDSAEKALVAMKAAGAVFALSAELLEDLRP